MSMIFREISRIWSELTSQFYERVLPPVDIYEEGGYLNVIIDLPGFQKDKITVKLLSQDRLYIKAVRTIELPGTKYLQQRPQKIEREIRLPLRVARDAEIIGKYENGVLTLKIPLEAAAKVKIE
ncbi:MAG: archaeal heat shock protein Hsp14 [Sulfolobaceae archaeon]